MNDAHVHEDDIGWTSPPDPVRRALRLKPLLEEPGASSPFIFGLAELPAGAAVPLHATRQAEVDHILSGRARVRMAGTVVDLSEGSCVYHPPGSARAIESVGPEPLRYSYTFATERLGQTIDPTPVAKPAPASDKTWLSWDETESWVSVEASKGLRIRVKRLMDRGQRREVIAGIGELDPGVHYTRHFHDQPEIYYIRGGEGIVYVGDSKHRVRRGSALYIGGGVVHGADSIGREPLAIFYVYGCEIAGHDVNWTPVEEIYTDVRRTG
ncbi:MAG TPA: cupin domain-containing protein [Candidatus Methylomirabilis sp.]|nr:cupin domain-containing protein [Candidatus Methylomirabilis sp.]